MLTQAQDVPRTSSPSVDTAPDVIEHAGRRSKWQDVRDKALVDPANWHRLHVCADHDQARRLRSRIRRGVARWGPAGAFDARVSLVVSPGDRAVVDRVVWIKSLAPTATETKG